MVIIIVSVAPESIRSDTDGEVFLVQIGPVDLKDAICMAICARCGQHTESETDACAACGGYALGARAYAASTAAAATPQAATGLRYEQSTDDPDPDEFWYEQYRQSGAGPFQRQRGSEPENGRQHFVPEQPGRTGDESAVAFGAHESGEWHTVPPQWQSDPWESGQPPEFSRAGSEWRSQPEPDERSSGGSALGSLPSVHTPFATAPSPGATPAGYAAPAYALPAYEAPGAGSETAGDGAPYRDLASTSAPRGYEMPDDLLHEPGPARPSYAADASEPGLATSPADADESQLTEPPRTDWPSTEWPRMDRSGTGRPSAGRSGTGWPDADALSTRRVSAGSLPGSGPLLGSGPLPGDAASHFSGGVAGTPGPATLGGAGAGADPDVAAAAALAALDWRGEGDRARGRGGVAGRDGNGRWIALAAAFVVLVIAAATAILVLGRHQSPPHGTTASGSRAAASRPAAVRDGLVTVAPAVVQAAHEKAVATFLNGYFAAINAHDYAAYRRLFSPAVRSGLSPTAFTSGYGSTSDSAVTLTGISNESHGRMRADVTFTSHQRAASSPNHAACTTWSISLFLTRQGHHFELATPPGDYSPAFRDCA